MPLGLAYLAAALDAAGIGVTVVDAWAEGLTLEALAEKVARRPPDFTAVTMTSPAYASAMRTIDRIRSCSTAPIIVGGPHPSALPEQCLQDNPNIDFVVIGEGEATLLELVTALAGGEDLKSIRGIAYRHQGKMLRTGPRERVENLDRLPFPAYHLFPLNRYRTHPPYGKKNPYLTLVTSRGCPYRCAYCAKSVFGPAFRAMSPARVVAQIRHMIDAYHVKEIHFYDDDFTLDMKRAEQICDLLMRAGVDISWSCTTRVDLVDENLLRKMKASGCWLISYGVESADPDILKNIRKGYTLDKVLGAFDLTRRMGIRTVAYLMAGLPGETPATLKQTIRFSKKLDPDFVSWGITALYPGSSLYEEASRGKLGQMDLRYTYQDRSWHASGSPYGDGYAIICPGALSRDELKKYVRRANIDFYLRPSYLIGFICKIRSFYEWVHFARGGLKFLFWVMKTRVSNG